MLFRSHRWRAVAGSLVLLAVATGGCGVSPVEWAPQRAIVSPSGGSVALSADGTVRPDTLDALAMRVAPPTGPVCPRSLRLAVSGRLLYAVWWAPRPDSGARLLAARSTDAGGSWSTAAPVDTNDVGAAGCAREPAAIAADSVTGYVHVTYALHATEGPGLFFSHSMDGGVTFHAPVPILYGERLGRTSVAADGDLVVVGFEDPNSTTPRIGLALSRTMGHIFEHRILPVSDDQGAANHPRTAIRGRRMAVAWERAARDGTAATLVVRAGTVR